MRNSGKRRIKVADLATQLLLVEKLREVEGIGPATVSKFRSAGFYTVESVAVTPVRELIDRNKSPFYPSSILSKSHIHEVWQLR